MKTLNWFKAITGFSIILDIHSYQGFHYLFTSHSIWLSLGVFSIKIMFMPMIENMTVMVVRGVLLERELDSRKALDDELTKNEAMEREFEARISKSQPEVFKKYMNARKRFFKKYDRT